MDVDIGVDLGARDANADPDSNARENVDVDVDVNPDVDRYSEVAASPVQRNVSDLPDPLVVSSWLHDTSRWRCSREMIISTSPWSYSCSPCGSGAKISVPSLVRKPMQTAPGRVVATVNVTSANVARPSGIICRPAEASRSCGPQAARWNSCDITGCITGYAKPWHRTRA